MRRYLAPAVVALSCAFALNGIARAQEPQTKVKTEGGAQTVTYTGCMQAGTETRSYILQNVVPVSTSRTVGTGGAVTTTTTYALVPEEKVELQQHVGHKVEVTGVLIPAGKGDAKYEATTKSKGAEEKTRGEVEKGPMPQLKVVSVKPIAESCS
jgi:hypothetical protein